MNGLRLMAIFAIALALAGCNRSVGSLNTRSTPQPLTASPTDPVESGNLPPAETANPEIQVATNDPNAPENDVPTAPVAPGVEEPSPQTEAGNKPKEGGPPVTREGMAGSWNVPSDNAECRIILAFTKWAGGYRAASRRCNSPEIGAVTAWDVKGKQVVLVDGSGTTVARLYASGGSRYDGTTNSGKPITFTR